MLAPDHPSIITGKHAVAARRTLRAIALFEALKGLVALIAVVGLVDLMHHDVRHLALALIGHFHADPAGHYPSILLHYADLLPRANMHALTLLAIAYISARLVEAYGLWHDRAWAEWLAALSGGIYVPFELNHFLHQTTLINGGVLSINVGIVGFLLFALWQRRNSALASHPCPSPGTGPLSRHPAQIP